MIPQGEASTSTEATVIKNFNTQLAAAVSAFKANHTGVSVWQYDSNAAFTTILDAPTKYGFVDATSYGQTGSFWGNDYHPGSAAQVILGKQISDLLVGTPW
jgi:phospholipase/lecithinase/hemolysin